MSTRNFVPRANNEGELGVKKKQWAAVNAVKINLNGVDILDLMANGDTAPVPQAVHSAAMHNAIARGRDITDYWKSGDMSIAIKNGTFKNIYVGDYIMVPITIDLIEYNVKWIVAHLDYFWHGDDMDTSEHHVVMIAADVVQQGAQMNEEATTEGGYFGTKLWKEVIPLYDNALSEAFGKDHVLNHRELLSNMVSEDGKAASTEWANVKSNIPTELMIYGTTVFGGPFDVGNKERQLAYFKNHKFSDGRKWFWLQSVASNTSFAQAGKNGEPTFGEANVKDAAGGIRPYFLLV